MNLRAGCEPPNHAPLIKADSQHPRYDEYIRWHNAMRAQFVQANSFTNWLRQTEDAEAREVELTHELHGQYCTWLRENVNCDNPTAEYKQFWVWLHEQG